MPRGSANGAQALSSGRRAQPSTSGHKILIAVDFGTTYSGVAYGSTREAPWQPESQNIVQRWGAGLSGEKVPSVLKYENDDIRSSFTWGAEAINRTPPGEKLYEWFKMGLDLQAQSRPAFEPDLLALYPSATALPAVRPKQCEKLVMDYLKSLKDATDRYFQETLPREVLGLPREYIITVPAMWSETAQDATRGCAAEAFLGDHHRIDEIRIIAEPEAAGVYALAMMPQVGLTEGDTFVICDAGGGTVDLASYGISKLSQSHIELVGRSIPSGDFCGSIFLNRIFNDYLLNDKLDGFIDPRNSTHMRWLKSAVDNDFERKIKPEFTGERGRVYYIDAFCFQTDSPRHGVRNDWVEVTAEELKEGVFDIVVSKICRLVTRQISKTTHPVKAVLLAGGFGQNAYLYSQIKLAVGSEVQVLCINQSRTAIVRGALISGLSRPEHQQPSAAGNRPNASRIENPGRIHSRLPTVAVVSRPAPNYYGVCVFADYDEGKELHRRGRYGRIPGERGRPDQLEVMEWFVRKGEQILEGVPKWFEMYYDEEKNGTRPPFIECPVYAWDKDEEPPDLPDHSRLSRPLLTLDINLSDIPDAELPTKRVGHRTFYHVNFEIYVTLRSADLEFVLGRGNRKYTPQRRRFSEL